MEGGFLKLHILISTIWIVERSLFAKTRSLFIINCTKWKFIAKHLAMVHLDHITIICKLITKEPFHKKMWYSDHGRSCLKLPIHSINWTFLKALCGLSPNFEAEPKSNWFVMENKLLVLEFQSRSLLHGAESPYELVCSNFTRTLVHSWYYTDGRTLGQVCQHHSLCPISYRYMILLKCW